MAYVKKTGQTCATTTLDATNATVDDLTVTTSVEVNGNVQVDGNLNVDGNTTLTGGLQTSTGQTLDLRGIPSALTSGSLGASFCSFPVGSTTDPPSATLQSTSTSYYVRIGRLVYINFDITLVNRPNTGELLGVIIPDSPFTFLTTGNNDDNISCQVVGGTYPTSSFAVVGGAGGTVNVANYGPLLQAQSGTNYLRLHFVRGTTSATFQQMSLVNTVAGSCRLLGSGFFLVD